MVNDIHKKYISQYTIVNISPALFLYGIPGFIAGIGGVSIVEIFVSFLYTLQYHYMLPGSVFLLFLLRSLRRV
jgi:hypothetical protein